MTTPTTPRPGDPTGQDTAYPSPGETPDLSVAEVSRRAAEVLDRVEQAVVGKREALTLVLTALLALVLDQLIVLLGRLALPWVRVRSGAEGRSPA